MVSHSMGPQLKGLTHISIACQEYCFVGGRIRWQWLLIYARCIIPSIQKNQSSIVCGTACINKQHARVPNPIDWTHYPPSTTLVYKTPIQQVGTCILGLTMIYCANPHQSSWPMSIPLLTNVLSTIIIVHKKSNSEWAYPTFRGGMLCVVNCVGLIESNAT